MSDQFYHRLRLLNGIEKLNLLDFLSLGELYELGEEFSQFRAIGTIEKEQEGVESNYCFTVFESTFQFIEKTSVKLKFDEVKVKHKRLVNCYEISSTSSSSESVFPQKVVVIVISEECSLQGMDFPVLAEFKKAYVLPFQNFCHCKQRIYLIFKNEWEKRFMDSLVLIDTIAKDLGVLPTENKHINAVPTQIPLSNLTLQLSQSSSSPALQDYQVLHVVVQAAAVDCTIIFPPTLLLVAETDSMATSTTEITSIHSVYHQVKKCLGAFCSSFSDEEDELFLRVIGALFRDRRRSRSISRSSTTLMVAMISESDAEVSKGIEHLPSLPASNSVDNYYLTMENASRCAVRQTVKSRPDLGWTVFEFFSGIGGMRLALPKTMIRDLPIHKICAYDISDVANRVYQHNFHSVEASGHAHSHSHSRGQWSRVDELRRVAINGLKLEDLDGRSDVWTMSPPCQPFTRTKGAHQRDHLDNRSKAILHLMQLLLSMKKLPRFIVLENVAGFVFSTIHTLWKRVMKKCRYRYREFLLSPHTAVGLPNSRKRYYFIAEHVDSLSPQSATVGDGDDTILEKLPARLAAAYPDLPCTIMKCVYDRIGHIQHRDIAHELISLRGNVSEFFNNPIPEEELSHLIVGEKILLAQWAAVMLSIVGPHDSVSFCFTKGYGKIFDRSAGSLFFPQAEGPLSLEEFQIIDRRIDHQKYQQDDLKAEADGGDDDDEEDDDAGDMGSISPTVSGGDRICSMNTKISVSERDVLSAASSRLTAVLGQVRLFTPEEMLALSGFPHDFAFPPDMPLRHRFQCIGNSVNVRVVQAVMQCLFEDQKDT